MSALKRSGKNSKVDPLIIQNHQIIHIQSVLLSGQNGSSAFTPAATTTIEAALPTPALLGPRMKSRILAVAAFLLFFSRSAHARIDAEALIGRPFGVGQITISGLDVALDANRVTIEEKNSRVHYPAVTQGALGRLI